VTAKPQLPPDFYANYGGARLRRQSSSYGRFTWTSPTTSEYVVCAQWRHRPEIGHIQYFTPGSNATLLLEQGIDDFRQAGARLVVANQPTSADGVQPLRDAGFRVIERLAHYERPLGRFELQRRSHEPSPISFARYKSIDAQETLAIERESFPWLWWSNAEDLEWYAGLSGVRIWTIRLAEDGRAAGTLGLTWRSVAGHIDRLAIHRAYQGQGLGRRAVDFALDWLRQNGAIRVTLTTQATNFRSQGLYQAAGFVETPNQQHLYGCLLDPTVATLLGDGRAI
jgi:ribosomal protein S18 acetylase RimI-like enzyme